MEKKLKWQKYLDSLFDEEDPFAEYEEVVQEDLRKGQYYEEYTDEGKQDRLGIMYSKSSEERISVKDQLLELYNHLNSENIPDFLNNIGLKDRISLAKITNILTGDELPDHNLAQYFSYRLEAYGIINEKSFMKLHFREIQFNENDRLRTKKFLVPLDKSFIEKDRQFYLKLSSLHKGKNCYHMPTFGMVLDEFQSRNITNYHSLIPALSIVWGLGNRRIFDLLPIDHRSFWRSFNQKSEVIQSVTINKFANTFPLTDNQNIILRNIFYGRSNFNVHNLLKETSIEIKNNLKESKVFIGALLNSIFAKVNISEFSRKYNFPSRNLEFYLKENNVIPDRANALKLSLAISQEFQLTRDDSNLLQALLRQRHKFYSPNGLEKAYLNNQFMPKELILIDIEQRALNNADYHTLINNFLDKEFHFNHVNFYINRVVTDGIMYHHQAVKKIGLAFANVIGLSKETGEIFSNDFSFKIKKNIQSIINDTESGLITSKIALNLILKIIGRKNIDIPSATLSYLANNNLLKIEDAEKIFLAIPTDNKIDKKQFLKALVQKPVLKPILTKERPKPTVREKEKNLVKLVKEKVSTKEQYIKLDNQASDTASDIVFEDYKKAFIISELQEPSTVQNLFAALKEATQLGYKKLNRELRGLSSENYVITGALPQPNNLKTILETFERLLARTEYKKLFNKKLIREFIYSQYPVNKEKPLKQLDKLLKEKVEESQNEFKYNNPDNIDRTIDINKYSGEEKEIAKLILNYQTIISDKEKTDFGQKLNEFKDQLPRNFLTELISLKNIESLRAYSIEFLNRSGKELSDSNIRAIGENLSRYQKQISFPLNVEKKWATVSYLISDKTLAYHTALMLEAIPAIRTPEEMLNDILQNKTALKWGDIVREARLREGLQSGSNITQVDFAKSLEFERSGKVVKGISDVSVSGWERGYNTDETLLIQAVSKRIGFKGESAKNFSLLALGKNPDEVKRSQNPNFH